MLDGNKTPGTAAIAGVAAIMGPLAIPAVSAVTATPSIAGPPITPPKHPGKAPTTNSAVGVSIFNYEREQSNKYQQVLQLLRLCFTQAYGDGDHLLDL